MANNSGSKGLLFLINPFLSAIDSLIHIRDKQSQKLLYLWFLVFGAAFCAVSDQLDSYRIIEDFGYWADASWNTYTSYLREYFSFSSYIKDFYAVSVQFFVTRFTDNYHWVFFIFAAVFGYFYIRSLKIFLRLEKIENMWVFYALLFIFCYSNPIFNINGMRFWTAAWIGVYVTLSVTIDKNYKSLLWLIVCHFIHGTFLIWVVLLTIALLTKKFKKIWIGLFIVSSFVSAVSYLNILHDYSYLLPTYMQNQVYSYTESEGALARMAGETSYGAAYADFLNNLPGYLRLIMSYILIFRLKDITKDEFANRLMDVFLSLAAMTNFLSSIPSMIRYETLTIPLLVIIWAMNYEYLKKYNKLFLLVPIFYAYSLLYWYRHVSWVTEWSLYALPAPFSIIKYLLLQ